jgi:hypothetical protein
MVDDDNFDEGKQLPIDSELPVDNELMVDGKSSPVDNGQESRKTSSFNLGHRMQSLNALGSSEDVVGCLAQWGSIRSTNNGQGHG